MRMERNRCSMLKLKKLIIYLIIYRTGFEIVGRNLKNFNISFV